MKTIINTAWSRVFHPTVFALLIGFFSISSHAQPRPWIPPSDVVFTATGTGQTTGHIATLHVTNNTDQPQQIDFGNLYIPSTGKHQSYVVPEIQSVDVSPMGSVTVDVYGYCADISRPPVGSGEPMPAPNTWLAPPNPITPDGPPSFIVVPAAVQVVDRKPGQMYIDNVPVGYVSTTPDQAIIVDSDKYPEQAASFLLDAINRITFTYDDLQPEGVINTPFSNNLPRERESVIQQTFWMYGAALTGGVYDKDQFAAQLAEQYENSTGKAITSAPPAEREKFESGTNDFWDSFLLVGAEAKVISNSGSGATQGHGPGAVAKGPNPSASAADPSAPATGSTTRTREDIEREMAKIRDMLKRAHPEDQGYLQDRLRTLEQELQNVGNQDSSNSTGGTAVGSAVAKGAKDAAKLATGEEKPPTAPPGTPETPPGPTEEPPSPDCECGDFSMKLRVKKPDGTYDRYFEVNCDPSDVDRIAPNVNATAANVAVGEEVEFEISEVHFACSCEQAAPCDTYTPRKIYSSEPKRNAKSGSFKIYTRDETCDTVKNNEDNTKVTAKPKVTEEECADMGITRQYGFVVNQVCQTESCGAVSCYVYVFIRL